MTSQLSHHCPDQGAATFDRAGGGRLCSYATAATTNLWKEVNVSRNAVPERKPERRSGKRIIAGTAFRLEFLVSWYYDAVATMAVPELY